MKRYFTSITFALPMAVVMLLLTACADVLEQEDVEGKVIRLSAGRAFDLTRAATDIQGTVFEADEEVNVFIKGTSATQVTPTPIGDYPTVFTTTAAVGDKNDLTPPIGQTPHYLIGDNSQITVTACYPKSVDQNTTSFTVRYDQTSDADYKASDLMMVAPINHVKNNETINLPFQHKMAKLIISAIGDPGVTMDGTITLGVIGGEGNGAGIFRTASISVEDGDFASGFSFDTNAGLSDRGSIVMTNGGAVLIPPQTITTADFITVTGHTNADPTTRECRFAIVNKTFEAGKTYKLTLAIGPDNFTTPETITGWSSDYGELTLMPSGGYQGVSIDAMPDVVYDGTYKTPTPDVWYGTIDKIQLKEGSSRDFIYNYVDNKNAGNAQVLVIGQNYYAGLAAVQGFVIKKASGKISFPAGSDRVGDDGTGIEFEVNKSIDAIKVVNTGDGAVTYTAESENGGATDVVTVDPIEGSLVVENIGTCYIRATTPSGMIDGQNYYYTDGLNETDVNNTDRYKVVVKAKPATKDNFTVTYHTGNSIEIAGQTKSADQYFVYNGKVQQLAALTVSDGEFTLARDIDYEAVLTNSKNVGNATLTVTGKKNYNATFTIDIPVCQATPTITVDETTLTMGIHQNTAPKNRRKTRTATTESWASANLTYTSSDPTVATISEKGLITGLKAGTTTITVNVVADASVNANWAAATPKSYTVTVVNSDFDFNFQSGVYNLESGTVNNTTKRVAYNAAYSKWVCPASGIWQLDCYGAQGANTPTSWSNVNSKTQPASISGTITPYNRGMGGRGAHIAGRIYLKKGQVLYVTVGEQGKNVMPGEHYTQSEIPKGKYLLSGYAWNGGGNTVWGGLRVGSHSTASSAGGYKDVSAIYNQYSDSKWSSWWINWIVFPISGGGGATDISLNYGTYAGGSNMVGYNANTPVPALAWKSPQHLYSRIIVAGGGGGALYYDSDGDGKGFADGGDGGAWKGGNGVFNDIGYGGQMNQGGFGGSASNWYLKNASGGSTLDHSRAVVYDDGPYAGGFSCYDGMFGEGGGYTMTMQGNGCGGGGWYGGGAGGESGANGSGAGGSSFMWTDKASETDRNGANSKPLYQYYTTTAESGVYAKNNSYFAAPATKFPDYVPSTSTSSPNYIPFFSEIVTTDAGANAGNGKAIIIAVELDDECVSK